MEGFLSHLTSKVLMFKQTLPTFAIINLLRPVTRICMLILALKGLNVAMLVKNANYFIYSFPKVCSLKKKRIVKIMVTYLFNAKSANVERVQIANSEKTILPDKFRKVSTSAPATRWNIVGHYYCLTMSERMSYSVLTASFDLKAQGRSSV